MKYSLIAKLILCSSLILTFRCEGDDDTIVIHYDQFTDDRDGTTYKTVKIGNQDWMAENLNYVTPSGSWVYEDNLSNASAYGRLYNWETANNACPCGWHLPSDDEWKQLEMYIGISQSDVDKDWWRGKYEGRELKAGYGWVNNWNGTDVYGFSALPGGGRNNIGEFYSKGFTAHFWSSTAPRSPTAWIRRLEYNGQVIWREDYVRSFGFSVRCVRHNAIK